MPTILYALGDPLRLQIVAWLAMADPLAEPPACQDFVGGGEMAKSTLSFHFKLLREAGLVRMVPQGRRRQVFLRREDVERRFPGLLASILATYRSDEAPLSVGRVEEADVDVL